MGIGIPIEDDRNRLASFLKHRQANSRIVQLLTDVKNQNDLKLGQVTTAQSASYGTLVESLDTALKNDWLDRAELISILNELEIAGRQHVLIYEIPQNKIPTVAGVLASPSEKRSTIAELSEFWEVPGGSFARVLVNNQDSVITKIVSDRTYHTVETLEQKIDYELFKRNHHVERSAVIFKLAKGSNTLQIRVPPREHGSGETTTRIHDFVSRILDNHFKNDRLRPHLKFMPINNAFPKIIANRTDFRLEYDSPEDVEVKANLTRRQATNGNAADLRDSNVWKFGNGYSRKSMRGSWQIGNQSLFSHMNFDTLQIDKNTKLNIARVFIPDRCSDGEIDHVIRRIQEHF